MKGNTALIKACELGHVETARALLDHGAAVDYQNKVFKFYFIRSLVTSLRDYSTANQLFNVQETLVRKSVRKCY